MFLGGDKQFLVDILLGGGQSKIQIKKYPLETFLAANINP